MSEFSQFQWWFETELNRRHEVLQTSALPTELSNRAGGLDGN